MLISELIQEDVSSTYLYHATNCIAMMRILKAGAIAASPRSQPATLARTTLPTISVTRSRAYAEGKEFRDNLMLDAGLANQCIIVMNRNTIKQRYKLFPTSQASPDIPQSMTPKSGGEYEEVIVVPKKFMPLKGNILGFYFNPSEKQEIESFKKTPWWSIVENSPYLLPHHP
jgi:hypothetical protein